MATILETKVFFYWDLLATFLYVGKEVLDDLKLVLIDINFHDSCTTNAFKSMRLK